MSAIVGAEEERPVDVRHTVEWPAGKRASATRVDVRDQDRAGPRTIALPQLVAIRAIGGREEQRAVHVRKEQGVGIRANVCHHYRTASRAIAFPQLRAVGPIFGREEERAVDVCEVPGIRIAAAWIDVLD